MLCNVAYIWRELCFEMSTLHILRLTFCCSGIFKEFLSKDAIPNDAQAVPDVYNSASVHVKFLPTNTAGAGANDVDLLHVERRSIKQVTEAPRTVELEVYSGSNRVYMSVDGAMVRTHGSVDANNASQ